MKRLIFALYALFFIYVSLLLYVEFHELGHKRTCEYLGGEIDEYVVSPLLIESYTICNISENKGWLYILSSIHDSFSASIFPVYVILNYILLTLIYGLLNKQRAY